VVETYFIELQDWKFGHHLSFMASASANACAPPTISKSPCNNQVISI
jgi:hypothetical protein